MSILELQSLEAFHLSLRKGSIASRGTTIITQKENKGEYNGIHGTTDLSTAWKWNNSIYGWDIYAHVIDQNGPNGSDGTPYRHSTNISDWSNYVNNPNSIPRCTTMSLDENQKGHKPLYSGTPIPATDKACVANTHNAGNFYNFPAATAGSNNASASSEKDMPNSICPKGWQLPSNSGTKSYQRLIRDVYGISDTDADANLLANPAMSFFRPGNYYGGGGSLDNRGVAGYCWSSTAYSSTGSYRLFYHFGGMLPQSGENRTEGFSIRCVSR